MRIAKILFRVCLLIICFQLSWLSVEAQDNVPSNWTSHWIWRESPQGTAGVWNGASLFRKEFTVDGPVASVKLFTSGMGAYRNYLNGDRLKQRSMLNPRIQLFPKELEYSVYDVTSQVHQGKNALGIVLGPGWYRDPSNTISFQLPEKARVQLDIVFRDGRKQSVITDSTWITHEAAVRSSTLYGGETYDRREEIDGWRAVEFTPAKDWQFAKDSGTMSPIKMVPSSAASELNVTNCALVTSKRETVLVIDAGKEIDGNLLFHLKGKSGGIAHVRYGNLLDQTGFPLPVKNHGEDQEDNFILAGTPDEAFSPAFTIHHFRYAVLELPADAEVLSADCLSYVK
jgi:alpha-L-rhamnosidase